MIEVLHRYSRLMEISNALAKRLPVGSQERSHYLTLSFKLHTRCMQHVKELRK
jgi:hypothetical protein